MNRLDLIEKMKRCHNDEVIVEFRTDRKVLGYKTIQSISDRWTGETVIEVNLDDTSFESTLTS